jgi:Pectate lyase superfamily protein
MTPTPHPPRIRVLATVLIAAIGFAGCGSERSVAAGSEGAVVPATASIDPSAFLAADRATTWNPGMMGVGGIPVRSTVCAKLSPRGGELDDTAQIQAAINKCPAGQIVQLEAGTFIINGGNFLLINKAITLRGAGPGRTTLAKTDGAKPFQSAVSAKPSPLIMVGPIPTESPAPRL